jgi:hypothetical protein
MSDFIDQPFCDPLRTGKTHEDAFTSRDNAEVAGSSPASSTAAYPRQDRPPLALPRYDGRRSMGIPDSMRRCQRSQLPTRGSSWGPHRLGL